MTLTFKIQLRDIKKPPVWRRIEIPASFTFDDFHLTIQWAFGWENYHLYQFQKHPYDPEWTVKIPDETDGKDFFGFDLNVKDPRKTLVSSFLRNMNLKKFVYVYDFGDDWIHDITLEKVDEKTTLPCPVCLAGKGACPPEDCGGPWGYEGIKRLFAEEPDSEESLSYAEWMGLDSVSEFDPTLFDIDQVNGRLEALTLKIPKQTKESKQPQKQQTANRITNPNEEFFDLLHQMTNLMQDMNEEERQAFFDEIVSDEDDDEDDFDIDDYYDIQGIYDLKQPANRYEVRIEPTISLEKTARTVQLPSNMTLSGFAQLITLALGQKNQPESFEFVDTAGLRYANDEEAYTDDDTRWDIDDTAYNTVGLLLQKKGETAAFVVRDGKKKKVVARYRLTLEKKGRFTAKTLHRIDLLKTEGLSPSALDALTKCIIHFEKDNPLPE